MNSQLVTSQFKQGPYDWIVQLFYENRLYPSEGVIRLISVITTHDEYLRGMKREKILLVPIALPLHEYLYQQCSRVISEHGGYPYSVTVTSLLVV